MFRHFFTLNDDSKDIKKTTTTSIQILKSLACPSLQTRSLQSATKGEGESVIILFKKYSKCVYIFGIQNIQNIQGDSAKVKLKTLNPLKTHVQGFGAPVNWLIAHRLAEASLSD